MSVQSAYQGARDGVLDPDGVVSRRRHNLFTVGGECDRRYPLRVTDKGMAASSVGEVPDSDGLIVGTIQDPLSVLGDTNAADPVRMSAQGTSANA